MVFPYQTVLGARQQSLTAAPAVQSHPHLEKRLPKVHFPVWPSQAQCMFWSACYLSESPEQRCNRQPVDALPSTHRARAILIYC